MYIFSIPSQVKIRYVKWSERNTYSKWHTYHCCIYWSFGVITSLSHPYWYGNLFLSSSSEKLYLFPFCLRVFTFYFYFKLPFCRFCAARKLYCWCCRRGLPLWCWYICNYASVNNDMGQDRMEWVWVYCWLINSSETLNSDQPSVSSKCGMFVTQLTMPTKTYEPVHCGKWCMRSV